jgi:hypothetical protein
LVEELGVDPGAALTTAYHAILHGELRFRPGTGPERVTLTIPGQAAVVAGAS